ncbi:MAG: hypothetical protein WCC21_00770 [Candidatus Acidiferrales bacterium]
MVLTKEESIAALENEVRLVLHLLSKIEPSMLDYRPSPKQRSLIDLVRYFVIMAPVQLRFVVAGNFTMETWIEAWRPAEAAARELSLEEVKAALAKQPALFAKMLGAVPDADFRKEIEMFGNKATRGVWFIRLPLTHYAAYRMQLFLYLKACGLDQLNTVNLWVGTDASADPPPIFERAKGPS